MSNKEILENAIRKAIDGGFKYGNQWLDILKNTNDEVFMLNQANALIFNHDFAKALWGEDKPIAEQRGNEIRLDYHHGWQYHLQQMVIAEDPIKYLGENI